MKGEKDVSWRKEPFTARDRPSSATIKALIDLHEFDHQRAWTRYCNAVVRGAAIGFCLRGGLHLLKFLFGLILRRKRSTRSQSLSEVFQDTLRYTGFLGAFAGVFVSVDEGLAAVFGPERCCPPSVSLQSMATCGAHALLRETCPSSDKFHLFQDKEMASLRGWSIGRACHSSHWVCPDTRA